MPGRGKSQVAPDVVLKYLARYTHRVGISNSRILSSENGHTTFAYKDYADKRQSKTCCLTNSEFVRRFLMHVLPHQFVRIRHCGFLANGSRTKIIAKIKNVLGSKASKVSKSPRPPTCPHCGSEKIIKAYEIIASYFRGSNAHSSKILPLVA
jgi:Putative transposase